MYPAAAAFSARRRSSVTPPGVSGAPPAASSGPLVAPRKASTWDSLHAPRHNPTASDISARKASATADYSTGPPPENSPAGSIAGRKASSYREDTTHMGGGARSSASDIAGRRATAMDRPPWDKFAGPPPSNEGSTWGWMSQIATITSSAGTTVTERNRVFYIGNIDYIFDNFNDQSLAIDDLRAVMSSYGVDTGSVEGIAKQIDPKMHGNFKVNSHNKQILLTTNMKFSQPRDPLNNLRQASDCFQHNLLAPLHFAGYIFDILIGSGCLGGPPPFMLLGMYGILGVLGGSTNHLLTTKDVETFISMWRVVNPDEAQELEHLVNDYNGTLPCMDFYNLLYRRNAFGKQRMEMFDTKGPHDPSFLFSLMDKDEDGFLLPADLQSFATIFGRSPSNEVIHRVTRNLDLDGDGKINYEDFRRTMTALLNGMTWEFWLVAILLILKL